MHKHEKIEIFRHKKQKERKKRKKNGWKISSFFLQSFFLSLFSFQNSSKNETDVVKNENEMKEEEERKKNMLTSLHFSLYKICELTSLHRHTSALILLYYPPSE